MIWTLDHEIGIEPPDEAKAFLKILEIVQDKEKYLKLVAETLSDFPDYGSRRQLIEKLGKFSGKDLVMLLHECWKGNGVNLHIVERLIERLITWGLVANVGFMDSFGDTKYGWDSTNIELCHRLGIIDNILLGESYFIRKYRGSVLALIVKKGGDEHVGTGFLVSDRRDNCRSVIVTAKHNVDPSDGANFVRFEGVDKSILQKIEENWRLHPDFDIAFTPVTHDSALSPINLRGKPRVLSRTVSLGYPLIATTDQPYLLVHGGELNAIVSTYIFNERRLFISNIVAPGNSGGPVLDEAGLCVGMIVNSLETKREGGITSASSAILSSTILEFVGGYLNSN